MNFTLPTQDGSTTVLIVIQNYYKALSFNVESCGEGVQILALLRENSAAEEVSLSCGSSLRIPYGYEVATYFIHKSGNPTIFLSLTEAGLTTGAIIGIVAGVLVLVAAIGGLIYYKKKH